jgi:hypothetical protein
MVFRRQAASPLSWVAAALLAGSVLGAATTAHGYRGPFEGRVLDADTRQPIQGAVVAVEWDMGHMTVAGQLDTFYAAAEVLTDANGYFRIKKKWSWNPWTNFRLDSRPPLIYKAGYGRVDVVKWHRIEEVAEYMKAQTEETRKRVGPQFYFNIEFENGMPVFLLRRLATVEERHRNLGFLFDGDALEKLKLLRAEENRERRALGMEEY